MDLHFRSSSYSGGGGSGTCVEVALNVPRLRAVRDSKDPEGGLLKFDPGVFRGFLTAVKAGRYERC